MLFFLTGLFAAASFATTALKKFSFELRKLCFQQAQMVTRSLVLLCLCHLQ
jgi:hypothetical protein